MGELVKVALTGDRVKTLKALRDALAATIEDAPAGAVAPLSKQLADVMRELDELNPPKQESTVDDLARKRAARKAAVSKRAAGGEQRGTRGRRPSGRGGKAT